MDPSHWPTAHCHWPTPSKAPASVEDWMWTTGDEKMIRAWNEAAWTILNRRVPKHGGLVVEGWFHDLSIICAFVLTINVAIKKSWWCDWHSMVDWWPCWFITIQHLCDYHNSWADKSFFNTPVWSSQVHRPCFQSASQLADLVNWEPTPDFGSSCSRITQCKFTCIVFWWLLWCCKST
jgi:hypothetical protein